MKYKFFTILIYAILLIIVLTSQNAKSQNYSLYGLAQKGGAFGLGVLYRFEYPSLKDSVVLNFDGANGQNPGGDLMLATDGNIYGTTENGGNSSCGVIYRINPKTYQDTVVFNYNKHLGSHPKGGLFQATNGILYGSTSSGGAYDEGVLYSFDITTNTQTVLFNFNGTTDGKMPGGHLLQGSNGILYGQTVLGGLYGGGVLYCYNINTGKDSVLINYSGSNGSQPKGCVIASNGLFYGTTHFGGTNNTGVFYSYDPVLGIQTVLMNFTGANGIYPTGDGTSLYETSAGLLYGIAEMGGTFNHGLLYSYNINTGYDSILHNFSVGILGQSPDDAGYMQLPGGIMIVPIDSGGLYNFGTLLSYDPINGRFKKLMDFNDTNGSYPHTDLITIENLSENAINNIQNNELSNLFPNPNNGIFTLTLNYSGHGCTPRPIFEVYNVFGQRIYCSILNPPDVPHSYSIDLGKQPTGIYLYRVVSQAWNVVSTGKFIVK